LPSPTSRHDKFPSDGPGFIRGQEHCQIRNLRSVHHTPDSVATWRAGGKVTALYFLRGNTQLGSAGSEQTWGPLSAGRTRVDAVDGNAITPQLHRQSLGKVHQGAVASPTTEVPGIAGIGAADVDDAAPTLRLQIGNHCPGAAQRPHIFHVEVMQ